MDILKMLEAKERMYPKTGANLVGVDDFELDPDDALYLVGHYESAEEAEAAKRERLQENPDEILHLYVAMEETGADEPSHAPSTSTASAADRDAFIRDFTLNPEKYEREWTAKAKEENPNLTDEQLEWSWKQLAHQFGLD